MADFRKWFPVLVVMLLLGVMTASAQVPPPLTCSTNAGVPPILRSEGLTELAGDLVLDCTNGDPTQTFLANIQVFANTNITSKLLATPAGYTEALLLLNEPTLPGGLRAVNPMPVGTASSYEARKAFNAFRGQKVSDTAVAWLGVPITPPGTNPANRLVIRVTNLRVDATRLLPAGAVGGGLLPQQLIVYVSISGATTVPVNNPQQVLGYVQQGMEFAVTNCANSDDGSFGSLRQCSSQSGDLFNPARTTQTHGGFRFTERFATAFKDSAAPLNNESFANLVMGNSETGFQSATKFPGERVGVPDTATRLIAKFSNVPKGVQIFVGTRSVSFAGTVGGVSSVYGGTQKTAAVLKAGTDAYGAGGVDATPLTGISAVATRYPTCSSSDSNYTIPQSAPTTPTDATRNAWTGWAEVALDATGGGMAVWEVTTTDANVIETAWFPVIVKYSSNLATGTPGLGTANVYGLLGPAYPSTVAANVSTLDFASAGMNYPRFLDAPPASRPTAFRTIQCQTNLLFPFVTNQAGFDTGVALINASKDPFSSSNANEGTCEINYYGKLADGSALTKTKEVSGVVASGDYLAFSISGASNDPKVTGNPGFQGYMIVRCNFSFAHGYAFVSDYGAQKLAHGYLALIMDAGSQSRSGMSGFAAEKLDN